MTVGCTCGDCVDWLCDNWQQQDEGIWEVRGGRRHIRLLEGHVLGGPRPQPAAGRQAVVPGGPGTLAEGPRQRSTRKSWPRAGTRKPQGVRAVLRLRHPRRVEPAHAAGVLPRPERSAMLEARWMPSAAPADGRAGVGRSGLPLRSSAAPDGIVGDEGTFNMCSFWLVEALTRAGRTDPERLEELAALRTDAGLRQPPGPVRRADGPQRRGPGQFSAGIHAPGLDQRRVQPRPQPGHARLGNFAEQSVPRSARADASG